MSRTDDEARKYGAFISYNHADRRSAIALHRALERYRIPRRLRDRGGDAAAGDRLRPIFRDRDELAASTDLAGTVRAALIRSEALIVICSPAAARSRWVNEEIRFFASLGRADRIYLLVIAGEPGSADPALNCFPPALAEVGLAEPLAADTRRDKDGWADARLKLIAGLLGLNYDDLRQREARRRIRRLAWLAAGSTAGLVLALALATSAWLARAEAVRQRNVAVQRTITAERTVRFVQSLFEVADPSHARGRTISAREVVDRGAEQVRRQLVDQPEVRTALGVTVGEVYSALGLFREADAMTRWTFSLRHNDPELSSRQYQVLGDVRRNLGEDGPAAAAYQRAIALARRYTTPDADILARALAGYGQAQTGLGNYAAASRSIAEALRLDLARQGGRGPDAARDLEAQGQNLYAANELAAAEPPIRRALAIRRNAEGPLSPSVSDDIETLGAIAYMRGDLVTAEKLVRSRLTIDQHVLGERHPDNATTMNNLARIMIERRDFDPAAALLNKAIAIEAGQRGWEHPDMAFMLANMALVQRETGRLNDAAAWFQKALVPARKHHHRNLGPILTDLAWTRCRQGRSAEGLRLVAEAAPLIAAAYPDDRWRTAWNLTIRAACVGRAGDRAGAVRLLRQASPTIAARWPAGTLYRTDLDQISAALR